MATGYVYHEIFGWHDTGTFVGDMPSDPGAGLQPYQNYENASLEFAGVLTANVTITIPSHEKTYFLRNVVTGSFDVYMKTASGSSYTVPKQNTFVACDGTNIHQIDFPVSISAFTVNQLTVVSAVSGTDAKFSTGTFSTNYRDWETDRKSTRLNSSHRL